MNTSFHQPVLLAEVLELLQRSRIVLDGTLGGGGHSEALALAGARVIALDRDPRAVDHAKARLAERIKAGDITIHLANFANVEEVLGVPGVFFDGILLDLGVSSHQLDDESRGFSFRENAPLDMRMGPDSQAEAAELLNSASQEELELVLREHADEPKARRMAAELVRRRERDEFRTSTDLVRAIRAVLGPRSGPSDFARIFQAVRIAVNSESEALKSALPKLRDLLKPSGVMVVISYHSGEDRVVKNFFRDWTRGCICPPRHPVCTCGLTPMGNTITRKAVSATPEEIEKNPRARSARLRAWQKNP